MAQEALRKAHHTVPKALLVNFAAGGKVLTRRRNGKEHPESIARASVRTHFYSVNDGSGGWDDSVERWLASDVESDFHALLPALVQGPEISPGSTAVIARYVSMLAMRSQTVVDLMEDIDRDVGGLAVMQERLQRGRISIAELSEVARRELYEECRNRYERFFKHGSRASTLRTMICEAESLAARLGHYAWTVTDLYEPLLIGDHPVVTPESGGDTFRGILPKGMPVFLPLAPHRLLVGQSPLFQPRQPSATAIGHFVNEFTARACGNAVFRSPETSWPSEVELKTERPHVRLRSWSISPTSGEHVSTRAGTALPVLADPSAQAVMERLDEARQRDMSPLIEQQTKQIMTELGIDPERLVPDEGPVQ